MLVRVLQGSFRILGTVLFQFDVRIHRLTKFFAYVEFIIVVEFFISILLVSIFSHSVVSCVRVEYFLDGMFVCAHVLYLRACLIMRACAASA